MQIPEQLLNFEADGSHYMEMGRLRHQGLWPGDTIFGCPEFLSSQADPFNFHATDKYSSSTAGQDCKAWSGRTLNSCLMGDDEVQQVQILDDEEYHAEQAQRAIQSHQFHHQVSKVSQQILGNQHVSRPNLSRAIRKCRQRRPAFHLAYCHEDTEQEYSFRVRRISGNQTKNIPKNYGKAIISFIERNRPKVQALLSSCDIPYEQFLSEFQVQKRNINTIADLRNLWLSGKYSRQMRILSCLFLRKHSLHYIFNSRITNFTSHIKYRQKLRQALKKPELFTNIKDY